MKTKNVYMKNFKNMKVSSKFDGLHINYKINNRTSKKDIIALILSSTVFFSCFMYIMINLDKFTTTLK